MWACSSKQHEWKRIKHFSSLKAERVNGKVYVGNVGMNISSIKAYKSHATASSVQDTKTVGDVLWRQKENLL